MQRAEALLDIYQKRGAKRLPLERVYRHLFDPELFLRAYGKIYRNVGAMTTGATEETVDGMCIQKIHRIVELLKFERYEWTPARRTEIPKANGKLRPLGIPLNRAYCTPYQEPWGWSPCRWPGASAVGRLLGGSRGCRPPAYLATVTSTTGSASAASSTSASAR